MSESRLLTDAERSRFARYLRENIESSRQMLAALGSIRLPTSGISEKYKQEIAAFEFVANWLESAESCTINPKVR